MKKTAVVTGASGFIGNNLVSGLLNKGYNVYAIDKCINEKLKNNISSDLTIIQCELSDILNLESSIQNLDVFYHLAWAAVNRTGVGDAGIQEENIKLSLDCLKFAIKHQCKCFIDSGSRQEYLATEDVINEETACIPVSEYGKGKLRFYQKASEYCKNLDIKYIHMRLFSLYGIDDHPWSLINTTISNLLTNQDVNLGPCLHKWNFMHITDLVDAIITLYEKNQQFNSSEIVNIASTDIRILKDFTEAIKDLIPATKGVLKYGVFVQNKESINSLIPDTTKFLTKTGWKEKIAFDEGIKMIINSKNQLIQ